MTIYERLKSFEYVELFDFISYTFGIYIKPENRDEFFEEFKNLSIDQMAQFIDNIRIYELKKSCKETIKDWLNTKLRFDGFFETASLFLNWRN